MNFLRKFREITKPANPMHDRSHHPNNGRFILLHLKNGKRIVGWYDKPTGIYYAQGTYPGGANIVTEGWSELHDDGKR